MNINKDKNHLFTFGYGLVAGIFLTLTLAVWGQVSWAFPTIFILLVIAIFLYSFTTKERAKRKTD